MTTYSEKDLLEAVNVGNIREIQQLLDQGISPNAEVDGWTALEKASVRNQYNVIEILIEAGVDPNREDEYGLSPLHMSCKDGHVNSADALMKYGARHDKTDKSGYTPLHHAAKSGQIEIVNILLKKGADPRRVCDQGNTPLHMASSSGHQEVVDIIIASGVDPNKENVKGQTPLMVATRSGQTDVVRGFLEHKWKTQQQLAKYLRLHRALAIAARQGHHDIFGLISQKLSHVDLHKAMTHCDKKYKKDDTFHKTPLEWAVKNQDKYLISELLRHEHTYHKESKELGLHCLHAQLTYEDSLKPIITQFTDQYPRTRNDKRLAGIIAVLPLLLTFSLYYYDIVFDGKLTKGYYSCSNLTGASPMIDDNCDDFHRSSFDYSVAFVSTVLLMATSLLASLLMVVMSKGFHEMINETRYYMYGRYNKNTDDRSV